MALPIVIALVAFGEVAATTLALALNRATIAPVRTYRPVAVAAIATSLLPEAVIWTHHTYSGTTASTVIPLILIHLAVAAISVATISQIGGLSPPTPIPHALD